MSKAIVVPVSLENKPYLTTINDYKDYYPVMGCRLFDVISLYEENSLSVDCYVDDEGAGVAEVNQYFLKPYLSGITAYPIYGTVVINLTDTRSGESAELDLCLVRKALDLFGLDEDILSSIT